MIGRCRLDEARAALDLPALAPVVQTVCRLGEEKGAEVLLDAISRLRAVFPVLRLVVVGDGRHREAYGLQAERLCLQDAVRFEGRVSHE